MPRPVPAPPPPPVGNSSSIVATGFGPPSNTLTEPVLDTVKRDLSRIVSKLKLVVFPNPFREDPGKALRDWDLWGPFFFIVFLGLTLSWSASAKKSEVFAVAFALLAAGAVILTLNVLLLGESRAKNATTRGNYCRCHNIKNTSKINFGMKLVRMLRHWVMKVVTLKIEARKSHKQIPRRDKKLPDVATISYAFQL